MDSWTDDEDDETPFISHEGGELVESIGSLLDDLNPSQVYLKYLQFYIHSFIL